MVWVLDGVPSHEAGSRHSSILTAIRVAVKSGERMSVEGMEVASNIAIIR
jgi:hypothetical protein